MKLDFFRGCVILVLAVFCGCNNIMSGEKTNDITTSVEAVRGEGKFDPDTYKIFITLLNESHPDNRIGYRFFERLPFVYGTVPENTAAETAKANALEKQYAKRPSVFVRRIDVTSKGWVPQKWTYYIVPVAEGFEMLWVVETEGEGLNEYYSAQQCFRMSGRTNEKWRHNIALTPAFSEYDLWNQQEDEGTPRTSLSFVRRNDRWDALPAIRSHLACRTPVSYTHLTLPTN